MTHHYVWLVWSSAFLLPWAGLYLAAPRLRSVMWRASLATAAFGLTEPIFVPAYWNPHSLFELAHRTRFDIESVIFSFAIGGIGAFLYSALTRTHLAPVAALRRREPLHRFHALALLVPMAAFVPLAFLPWNVIYAAIFALLLGSVASVVCRPSLARQTLTGGALFLGLYAVFMVALVWTAPGYIAEVWNLPALSGVLVYDIPLEEFLFGAAFGLYWSSVYEHFTWTERVAHAHHARRAIGELKAPSPLHPLTASSSTLQLLPLSSSVKARAGMTERVVTGVAPREPERGGHGGIGQHSL